MSFLFQLIQQKVRKSKHIIMSHFMPITIYVYGKCTDVFNITAAGTDANKRQFSSVIFSMLCIMLFCSIVSILQGSPRSEHRRVPTSRQEDRRYAFGAARRAVQAESHIVVDKTGDFPLYFVPSLTTRTGWMGTKYNILTILIKDQFEDFITLLFLSKKQTTEK